MYSDRSFEGWGETRGTRVPRMREQHSAIEQTVTPTRPRLDWVQELRDLVSWANNKLNSEHADRQLIAEHMIDTIERLLIDRPPLDRPF